MQITVDTSALIAVITAEKCKPAILASTRGKTLVAPPSIHWEIGKAFSAMVKRKRISLAQTHQCLDALAEIPIKYFDVSLKRSLELVDRFQIYAYDAYLLVCAVETRSPLLTIDDALASHAKRLGIVVVEVSR